MTSAQLQRRSVPQKKLCDSPWPESQPLFTPLSVEQCRLFEQFFDVLAAVRPLKAVHRKMLPRDIVALSRLLTVERADLRHPYWSMPGLTSAYLYYFLPWNILRLTRMLNALPLPNPEDWLKNGLQPWLCDAGAGPLTMALALWLARPQWRSLPLGILALDTAAQPLDLGRRLLESWAKASNTECRWQIRVERAPVEHLPRYASRLVSRKASEQGRTSAVWLMTAANVLNELYGKVTAAADAEDEDSHEGSGRLEAFFEALEPLWLAGDLSDREVPLPAALFVEPGTRLGGKTIMRLRDLALDAGLHIRIPCTHEKVCPLTRSRQRGWCHFTFDVQGTPTWLHNLSEQAGLSKQSLSLAPLLMLPEQNGQALRHAVRVLSAPFAVPGIRGQARYACMAGGIALLEQAEALASGDVLPLTSAVDTGRKDAKSGASILQPRRKYQGKPTEKQAGHVPPKDKAARQPLRQGHERTREKRRVEKSKNG